MTGIQRDERNQIVYESTNTTVLNQSDRQLVVANNLENITIINTEDAVYAVSYTHLSISASNIRSFGCFPCSSFRYW